MINYSNEDLSSAFEQMTGHKAKVTCERCRYGSDGMESIVIADTGKQRHSLRFSVPDDAYGYESQVVALKDALKRLGNLFPFQRKRIPFKTDRPAPRLLRRPVRISQKKVLDIS